MKNESGRRLFSMGTFLLASLFLLTSCGSAPQSSSAMPEPQSPAQEDPPDISSSSSPQDNTLEITESNDFADLNDFSVSGSIQGLQDDSSVDGYASQDGFYRVISRTDGSVNACYVDFKTQQEIYLCGQPNCTHDSEACTAWFPFSNGLLRFVPVGDKVVVLHGGNPSYGDLLGDASVGYIDIMNPDGSQRSTCFRFSKSSQISTMPRGGLARDDENVYFVLTSYDPDVRTLCAVNSISGKVFALCELPEQEEKIIGGADTALVLSYSPNSYDTSIGIDALTTNVIRLDPKTQEQSVLFTHPYSSRETCSGNDAVLFTADNHVQTYDLQTGELKTDVQANLPPEFDAEGRISDGIYGDKLLAHTYHNSDPSLPATLLYYAINTSTGESTPLNYSYQRDNSTLPCTIMAQTDTAFLCVTGTEERIMDFIDENGEKIKLGYYVNSYSFIDQTDFWSGNAAFTPVTDAKS